MALLLLLVVATAAGWLLGGARVFGAGTRRGGHITMLAAIGVLLFAMGMSLGAQPEFVAELGRYGIEAATISLSGSVGAVLAVTIVRRLWRVRQSRYRDSKDIHESV